MNLSGVYNCAMSTPIGELPIVLTINVDQNNRVTGTLQGAHGLCEFNYGSAHYTGFGDAYIFFSCMPHDCYLDFCGRVEPDGTFYGANFHKGHTSEFSGKKV